MHFKERNLEVKTQQRNNHKRGRCDQLEAVGSEKKFTVTCEQLLLANVLRAVDVIAGLDRWLPSVAVPAHAADDNAVHLDLPRPSLQHTFLF